MMRLWKFFDAVPLEALFPTFAFTHSAYSENLTDVPFGGLYHIITGYDNNKAMDRNCSSKEIGINDFQMQSSRSAIKDFISLKRYR